MKFAGADRTQIWVCKLKITAVCQWAVCKVRHNPAGRCSAIRRCRWAPLLSTPPTTRSRLRQLPILPRQDWGSIPLQTVWYTANTLYRKFEKQIFPEMELRGLFASFYSHVSESDLYIPTIGPPILPNWERGRAVSFLGIHESDLVCSVPKRIHLIQHRYWSKSREIRLWWWCSNSKWCLVLYVFEWGLETELSFCW